MDEGRIAHSSGAGIIQRGAAARPLADDAAVEELLAADLLAPGLWAPGLTGGAPCTTLSYRRSPVRQAVTVSLPPDLGDELRAASRDAGVSRSAVVREALRRYLADRDFQRLRRRLVPEAEQRGLFTDEDVFRRLA